jgi:DNA mismatch endonuclease (patch repair protein)
MDRLTPERRSLLMSRIRGKDTLPELTVRSVIHRMGYRFRLHRKDLPGKPDIVFPRKKKAIFVHGCFWHGHYCKEDKMPKTRMDFWNSKIKRNRERDKENCNDLKALGWDLMVVWECQTKNHNSLIKRLKAFLLS